MRREKPPLSIRGLPDGRTEIFGQLIPYNTPDDLGDFIEYVTPSACDHLNAGSSFALPRREGEPDCYLAHHHDGELAFENTPDALCFRIAAPLADLPELLQGEWTAGYRFTLTPDGAVWAGTENGRDVRTITNILRIYEVLITPRTS